MPFTTEDFLAETARPKLPPRAKGPSRLPNAAAEQIWYIAPPSPPPVVNGPIYIEKFPEDFNLVERREDPQIPEDVQRTGSPDSGRTSTPPPEISDINFEPFSAIGEMFESFESFESESAPSPDCVHGTQLPAEPPHCVQHCNHQVCRSISFKRFAPPCCCSDSSSAAPASASSDEPEFTGPTLNLDVATMRAIAGIEGKTDPTTAITIRLDAWFLLDSLRRLIAKGRINNRAWLATMSSTHNAALARSIIDNFFEVMRLYFTRILGAANSRTLTIEQLNQELNLYMVTGFADWIEKHGDARARNGILFDRTDPMMIMGRANQGLPLKVRKFWCECLNGVMDAFVWRHQEVQRWQKEKERDGE
jgi:hypothetical protein